MSIFVSYRLWTYYLVCIYKDYNRLIHFEGTIDLGSTEFPDSLDYLIENNNNNCRPFIDNKIMFAIDIKRSYINIKKRFFHAQLLGVSLLMLVQNTDKRLLFKSPLVANFILF